MHKKLIKKGFQGLSFPSFNSSNFFTSSGTLDIGQPFQNLLQVPEIGNPKPWAQQQFGARSKRQQESFHNDLQVITSPQKQSFDPTFGGVDIAQTFADKTQPFIHENKLRTGLALQNSSDSATQLLGKMQAEEAIAETTKTPDWAVNEKSGGKESFGEKFSNSTFGKNFGAWSAGLDMANSALTGIMGEKNEYTGAKGDITRGIDGAYDSIQQVAGSLGPVGQAVSLGMQANKLLGNVANKLGGGTDGMTTTDAIMGSAFMQLTPLGLINGFGGKKADTITKDTEAFEQVGSSYGATSAAVDDALTKSGKKYGLFSSGARNEANWEIAEAKRQQFAMADIASEAQDRFSIRNSMSAINGNRRAYQMQGGYDQSAVRVGRHGLSVQSVLAAKRVVSALKFKTKPIKESVEESQPVVDSFQQGGILELTLQDVPEEYLEPMSTIEEVTLDSILPEFKEGGKVNVIPEGALHARLHHMDNADNLTKKGIPVVSEKEGGELEQQAEIEREEIIFRLEVTKKLEELLKKYSSDEISQKDKDAVAIEAGKLLVEEILNNTIDNTNNLL